MDEIELDEPKNGCDIEKASHVTDGQDANTDIEVQQDEKDYQSKGIGPEIEAIHENTETQDCQSLKSHESCKNDKCVILETCDFENENVEPSIEAIGTSEPAAKSLHDLYETTEIEDFQSLESHESENNEEFVILKVCKQNIKPKTHQEDLFFLDRLFPKKTSPKILVDEDIISLQESDLRIIWFQLWTAVLSLIAIYVKLYIILSIVNSRIPVVMPKIDKVEYGFPSTHLAIIDTNGNIYDISLTETISPSQDFLFKLPRSVKYHGYSDPEGFVYFIDGAMKKPVVKYHPFSLGSTKHRTIKFKKQPVWAENSYYFKSQLIGNKLWLQCMLESHSINFAGTPMKVQSSIWYTKKQSLHKGPNLDERLDGMDVFHDDFCTVALNRSHLFLIAFEYASDQSGVGFRKRVALLDFDQQTSVAYPGLPAIQSLGYVSCHAAISFDKQSKPSIMLQFRANIVAGASSHINNYLLSYDLSHNEKGSWMILQNLGAFSSFNKQLFYSRGLLFSVMENGLILDFGQNNWKMFAQLSNITIETVVEYQLRLKNS